MGYEKHKFWEAQILTSQLFRSPQTPITVIAIFKQFKLRKKSILYCCTETPSRAYSLLVQVEAGN